MAVITPTFSHAAEGDPNVILVTWPNMQNGDTGAPVKYSQWSDRSIQVEGTLGAAGNMAWEGSLNGGANYRVLANPQGTAINATTLSINATNAAVPLVRPHVTAGDGTTSLTVSLHMRKIPVR